MLNWIKKLGDNPERLAKSLKPIVDEVNELEPHVQALSDHELRSLSAEFRARRSDGESLDDLLPEAFAAAREATIRSIGDRQFDVQIMGGIVLHRGAVAEMKTGEGKTYVAPLAAYLNALDGKGVHIVTVNDYLARRDRDWMGPIFEKLGLTAGVIYHDMPPEERRAAYRADITYGTNNEFGFDYLRDNMVHDLSQRSQRGLHYAIVDEIDNILIDEARTPLIISGQAEESAQLYYSFARLVMRLHEGADYTLDLKQRTVSVTEAGIAKVEKQLKINNLYAEDNYQFVHYLQQALRAKALYHRGKDYVLYKDSKVIDSRDSRAEVVIVDEFTGRLMTGRRYGEGLHQAVEAKEGVNVRHESRTLATITFQNLFRLYDKLAGMTGTAKTEEEELRKIYGVDVEVIPTHMPMIREDHPDLVFKSEKAKYQAVVKEISEANAAGRPVLVGTTSIESSEHLSALLRKSGLKHQVLNAKYHEKEAGIVALAGEPGSITIATNMAGRGTDIKLGEGIADIGGLYIIGTERHDSRRIDNQLRGRSGRQGDRGESRFFISLEDELMRRFQSERIATVMERLGLPDDQPIEHKLVTRSIESAQSKVEGHNFDIRKHVVEFDDVINTQRAVIYGQRERYLRDDDLTGVFLGLLESEVTALIEDHRLHKHSDEPEIKAIVDAYDGLFGASEALAIEQFHELDQKEAMALLLQDSERRYARKAVEIGEGHESQVVRWILLQTLDYLWVEHLSAIEELRQGIGLVAYGQQDPLVAFKKQGFSLFKSLQDTFRRQSIERFFRLTPKPVISKETVLSSRSGETSGPPAPQRRKSGRTGTSASQPSRKIGRNQPCWCGSGKKFKRCHGR